MLDITNNWNPDSTDIPPMHYDTLCHFDYANETQRESAYLYRAAEVPFVVYNIPEVDAVVKKWSDVDYMHSLLGGEILLLFVLFFLFVCIPALRIYFVKC